jgi:hypothetical protein
MNNRCCPPGSSRHDYDFIISLLQSFEQHRLDQTPIGQEILNGIDLAHLVMVGGCTKRAARGTLLLLIWEPVESVLVPTRPTVIAGYEQQSETVPSSMMLSEVMCGEGELCGSK